MTDPKIWQQNEIDKCRSCVQERVGAGSCVGRFPALSAYSTVCIQSKVFLAFDRDIEYLHRVLLQIFALKFYIDISGLITNC